MRLRFLKFLVLPLALSLGLLSASPIRAELVSVPPPPLPSYDQPAIPGPGYVWIPGNWAYDEASGYFWVPGTWVRPPFPGLLWTPSYWSFNKELNAYGFHQGFWATEVGFYGGVHYGFGYNGTGYSGGYWRDGNFFYNRDVNNLAGVVIPDVFSQPVDAAPDNPVSFLGGPGGINIQITPQQVAVGKLPHVTPTIDQKKQVQKAKDDPGTHEKNGGPKVGATKTAGDNKTTVATTKKRPGTQKGSTGGEIVKKGGAEGQKVATPPGGAAGTGGVTGKANATGEAQKVPPKGGEAGTAGEQTKGKTAGEGKPFRLKTGAPVITRGEAPPPRNESVRVTPPRVTSVAPPRVARVAPPRVTRVAPPRVARVAPPRITRVAPPRITRVAPRVTRAAPRVTRAAPRRAPPRVNRVAPRAVRAAPRVNRPAPRRR